MYCNITWVVYLIIVVFTPLTTILVVGTYLDFYKDLFASVLEGEGFFLIHNLLR